MCPATGKQRSHSNYLILKIRNSQIVSEGGDGKLQGAEVGREAGMWEGREMKGRFQCEFRPERAGFKEGTVGQGARKELGSGERGAD